MNNKDLYDKTFLWDTLFLLQNQICDLSSWSVYNDDILNEEISELEKQSDAIRKKLIEMDKQGQLEKGGEKNGR